MSLTSLYRSRGCLFKLVPPDGVQVHPGKCRALAHKVNKLLMFLLAESTDLLEDIMCYIMVTIVA